MSRREELEKLRTKLLAGARKGGLTEKQCRALAAQIDLPPLGRPQSTRAAMWVAYCLALEHTGVKPKAAVDMTAKHFDRAARTVYAARSRLLSSNK